MTKHYFIYVEDMRNWYIFSRFSQTGIAIDFFNKNRIENYFDVRSAFKLKADSIIMDSLRKFVNNEFRQDHIYCFLRIETFRELTEAELNSAYFRQEQLELLDAYPDWVEDL